MHAARLPSTQRIRQRGRSFVEDEPVARTSADAFDTRAENTRLTIDRRE